MTDSKSIPTKLQPGMKVKVSDKYPVPSHIRKDPGLDDDLVIGSVPVHHEMKVLACVPKGVLPEQHPYETIRDALTGVRWWYVRYVGRDANGRQTKLEGWASETGPISDEDEDTIVYYLVPAEKCRGGALIPGGQAKVSVGREHLNLRAGPETSCETVHDGRGLKDGDKVVLSDDGCVRNQDMNWWFVEVVDGENAGKIGWVSQGRDGEAYLAPA